MIFTPCGRVAIAMGFVDYVTRQPRAAAMHEPRALYKLSLAAVDTWTCRGLLSDVEVSKAPNRFPETGVLNRVTGSGGARDEAPRRHSR